MIAWIFANEEYTELYHRYFSEFISEWFDNGNFANMIDSVSTMIAPYVEKDPTKFCTYEEFETGISTLKEFCQLRAESIEGQLNGTIGSTSETQKNDTLIDAGNLQISDMGTMQNSMDGGINKPDSGMQNQPGTNDHNGMEQLPSLDEDSSNSQQAPSNNSDSLENSIENGTFPQPPGGQMQGENPPDQPNRDTQGNVPADMNGRTPNANSQNNPFEQSAVSSATFILIAISVGVLIVGVAFAFVFRRRKR